MIAEVFAADGLMLWRSDKPWADPLLAAVYATADCQERSNQKIPVIARGMEKIALLRGSSQDPSADGG